MPTVLTQVDTTIGNYEQVFIYTLNASFNGVVGDIDSAKIKVFFPSFLNIFLGDIGGSIKKVIETETPEGTEVVFDFGKIEDLGIAVRLGFGVSFSLEAPSGTTFICRPIMFINDEEFLESISDEIELMLSSQFELSREIVLPIATPSSGSTVFYKVTLQNFGDLGAPIEKVEIVCPSTQFLDIDESFIVKGEDTSTKFPDTSANDILGTFKNNSLKFIIPAYRGERYEFIYRAVLSNDLEVGEQITTTVNWSIDSVSQSDELHEFNLAEPIFDASISLYAPDYSLPSEFICYRMGIKNVGNQILQNSLFENNLPTEVDYYQFSTGSFHIAAIKQNLSASYYIDYETENGAVGELGPYNTDVNTKVDLTEILQGSDVLSKLFWRLESLGIGVESKVSPELLGIIKSNVAQGSSLVNHIHLIFDDEGGTSERVQNSTTLIANYCTLRPSLSSSVGNNPVRPNEEFTLTFNVNCRNSRLQEPILAFLMPKELVYIGNENYRYSDIFENSSPPSPPVEITYNFNEVGDTLVKFMFTETYAFSFKQLSTITISFDVKVAVGALGSIALFALLNTENSIGVIPNSVDIYSDKDNIAGYESVSKNYAKSNIVENTILFFVSTASNKKVKGQLDTQYTEEPNVGKTVNGGSLEYLITVKNIGNADLEEIQIVDILPHIGDTGVIETGVKRDSKFPVYALSEVVATLMPENDEAQFDIAYSTSTDPIRFGPTFDIIGSDDNWTENAPEDLSLLRAFKVTTKNVVLKPSQTLKVAINASAPVGIPISLVAWNSFATDVSYKDLNGESKHLLAIEPEKVGVEIVESAPETGRISGFAWVDEQIDGLYTQDEPFVNDVAVVLYDENGTFIRYTSTRSDLSGEGGKYSFENLPLGKYYVRFFIDDKKLKFTSQKNDVANGSKASRTDGRTQLYDLNELFAVDNVIVGILPKGRHTLGEIMKINHQARGVVRDIIKSQMLLTLKQEDVIDLLK